MRGRGPHHCVRTPEFALLRKPYIGGGLEMVLVLPAAGRFVEVRDRLRHGAVARARDAAQPVATALGLPRFSIDAAPDVDVLLHRRFATAVYSPDTADLSGMSPDARKPGDELFVAKPFDPL